MDSEERRLIFMTRGLSGDMNGDRQRYGGGVVRNERYSAALIIDVQLLWCQHMLTHSVQDGIQ